MIELFLFSMLVPLTINLFMKILRVIVEVSAEGDETNKGKPITAILDDDGTEIEPFAYRIGDDGEIE